MVAEERLYSLTEMADDLGLAEPTARRYRDAFEEFLPSVGVGRRRKFTEPAKHMLARIAALVHEQKMPVEVVRRILTSERTQAELSLSPSVPLTGDVTTELRSVREALSGLCDQIERQDQTALMVAPRGDAIDTERLGTAVLSLRELITESVGVILRQMERIQEAHEETRFRLQQLNDDLFRRDEQAQMLMEATAQIAARCEEIALRTESAPTEANGRGR